MIEMAENPSESPILRMLRPIAAFIAGIFVVAYALLDAVVFPLFRPLVRYLSGLRLFAAIGALVGRLPPYLVLIILAVPFVVIEPLKVVALWWVAVGHPVSGLILLAVAEVLSLLVVERLYQAGRGQLLKIRWLAPLLLWSEWLVDLVLGWIKATAAWKWAAGITSSVRLWFRGLFAQAH